jgi:tripartite-type tricarboxylate transporter receptor subunit TctC
MHRTGVRIEQVQYRGATQALTDVGRGDITMFLAQEAGTQAFVEAGQVRPLAVASPARSPSSPDVPTFAEQGLAGFDAMSFFSLVVPPERRHSS